MNRLISTLTTAAEPVSTGLINTANSFNNELYAFVVNGGLTVIVVMFLIACFKKGWGVGAILGGLLVAALAFWALNGGFQVIGNLINGEFV